MGKASFNGYVQGLFMMIVDMFMLRGIDLKVHVRNANEGSRQS